ncbi:MAG TPA: dTDP-4-dehydrorhamnose 3,5-epimerase [Candidatus Moranbacteria bacterium]|nr:dTDP-4-dehydrorhamnose 3,5-epimerase [Candidatus Moranbacteria bacterium]
MEFVKTKIEGVYLVKPKVFGDSRGFFMENYSKKIFAENGISQEFVQDNHSMSASKGVLRGLHFQKPPLAQAKLIRVTKGAIYDVIVDIRKNSKTFGQWEGHHLSAKNFDMLYVPQGFAHGFMTLEDNTEVQYKCDNFYSPQSEGGIIWNDLTLNISWPIKEPILSEKDKTHPQFNDFNSPF